MTEKDNFPVSQLILSAKASELQIDNSIPAHIMPNIEVLKQNLERVRTILGNKPMHITSGYRCPKLNAAVGGSANSAHMLGFAADFVCPEFGTPEEIVRAIAASSLDFDQAIVEAGRWVHISFAPAMRRNTITMRYDAAGNPTYTKGIA